MLVERGLASTRAKAQALILSGKVEVDGVLETKMGHSVKTTAKLRLMEGQRYVSRGGEKLEGALDDFKLFPTELVCLDVGSSTGGFTDCLLQRGACFVYAVDVGRHQLADSLRGNPRVCSIEETHILSFSKDRLEKVPTFCVIDVSFISLTKILVHVRNLLPPMASVVALVKPQFEVGPKFLKKGVVRDENIRQKAVLDVEEFAKSNGFSIEGRTLSKLKGPKGNQEYFLYLKVI